MMGTLNLDLYRRDLGWDYVVLTLPDGRQVRLTVKNATRNVLSLTIRAPKDVRIENRELQG